ncbi:MAG: N-6 DNA methylase [Rhodospirillaceae bacterium]|nr:N-6 DNA methylase [Rhodospirillaceae bacterium]
MPTSRSRQTLPNLEKFFRDVRRLRAKILEAFRTPAKFCIALLDPAPTHPLVNRLYKQLEAMGADEHDYAVSSTYAVLIGPEKRKALSAYFTPPAVAAAAMRAARAFLDKKSNPTILDPACGGGSFIVPITRELVGRQLASGLSIPRACNAALKQVYGLELEPDLARLAERLLGRMLEREFSYKKKLPLVIRRANALSARKVKKHTAIIGNPPYGRVLDTVSSTVLRRAGDAANGGHTNLYALFILRALDWVQPGGGLVFILPTSFVAGPYFAGLRKEILARASVVSIDVHNQRENLFLGAVQDICILTLARRQSSVKSKATQLYEMGLVDECGHRTSAGKAEACPAGQPWTLPVPGLKRKKRARTKTTSKSHWTLEDYGYRMKVGKVVPTRERTRLKKKFLPRALPLIWASDIRPTGRFIFRGGGERSPPYGWFLPYKKDKLRYIAKRAAVLVQRSSNRDQKRRLNAAAVTESFVDKKGRRGYVAENHVIVLEATNKRPLLSPRDMVKLLHSEVLNERFSSLSGSFNVSATLLRRLSLPDPSQLRITKALRSERKIRRLFEEIPEVLVPEELGSSTT